MNSYTTLLLDLLPQDFFADLARCHRLLLIFSRHLFFGDVNFLLVLSLRGSDIADRLKRLVAPPQFFTHTPKAHLYARLSKVVIRYIFIRANCLVKDLQVLFLLN